ncbi:MAG TPA: hypothetical protein VFS43_38015 [Polyangiaceae bacterium]|nr:hypothetical protein [Polyangiaceae bacterium]
MPPWPPLDPGLCAACGGALSASGSDGYWLLEGRAWHAGGAPWGRHGFPYGWVLRSGERLRRLWGRRGGVPRSLARALSALEAAASAWPPAEPAPLLREAGRAAAWVVHWGRRARARR